MLVNKGIKWNKTWFRYKRFVSFIKSRKSARKREYYSNVDFILA